MDSVVLLNRAQSAGLKVSTDGDRIIIRGPKSLEPLAKQLLAHKAELLPLLNQLDTSPEKQPPGKVGRWGKPCPECGDEWQWPTTTGEWLCSWCFVLGRRVVREV